MNILKKQEFRIDEKQFGITKHYYIYHKKSFLWFSYWDLYPTDMNNGQFTSFAMAEDWIRKEIYKKRNSSNPVVTSFKFLTI